MDINKSTLDVIASYKKNTDIKMKELADLMGQSYPTLQGKLNPEHQYNLAVGDIVPLLKLTGNYDLIYHLNARLGLRAVKVKEISAGEKIDVVLFTEFTKETGEAMAAIGTALADNKIDRSEKPKIRKELNDLQEIVTKFQRLLEED